MKVAGSTAFRLIKSARAARTRMTSNSASAAMRAYRSISGVGSEPARRGRAARSLPSGREAVCDGGQGHDAARCYETVSYTHLRAHETPEHLVCRLLLEKKKKK